MLICTCARCGEPLTKPAFYKGKPYGYTCITFVDPSAKPKPTKETYCESSDFVFESPGSGVSKVVVTLSNGKKCAGTVARYGSEYRNHFIQIVDSIAYVMLTDKQGKNVWKWQNKI
jgi:hypothetical protein